MMDMKWAIADFRHFERKSQQLLNQSCLWPISLFLMTFLQFDLSRESFYHHYCHMTECQTMSLVKFPYVFISLGFLRAWKDSDACIETLR